MKAVLIYKSIFFLFLAGGQAMGQTSLQDEVFDKIAEVDTSGETNFKHAAINLYPNQNRFLVGQYSGVSQLVSLTSNSDEVRTIPLPDVKFPVPVPNRSRVLAGRGDGVVLLAPLEDRAVVASLPHVMQFGDLLLPAVSPDGTLICTRPAYDQFQVFDAETGRALTAPIPQTGRLMKMAFTSDSRYLCTLADKQSRDEAPDKPLPIPKVNPGDDGLRVWEPRTGRQVVGPMGAGINFRYTGSIACYDSGEEQFVTVNNGPFDQFPLSSKLHVHRLGGGESAIAIDVPCHVNEVRWIDSQNLLVSGRSALREPTASRATYDQSSLLLIQLGGPGVSVDRLTDQLGDGVSVSREGGFLAATVRTEQESLVKCWKVGQPDLLWSKPGRVVGFGRDAWLLIASRGGEVSACASSTGDVLFKQVGFRDVKVRDNQIWLFQSERFAVWQSRP